MKHIQRARRLNLTMESKVDLNEDQDGSGNSDLKLSVDGSAGNSDINVDGSTEVNMTIEEYR